MDWNNPRILYASIFQVVRRPWTVISGGPDSGLWRSTDGGDTWVDITRNSGLPKGHLGRIGVASSPAKQGRVWAIIEAEDGALFRSDDYGETWDRLSERVEIRERGWYYNHLFADTQDAETCYVQSMQAWKSIDGGKTWSAYATPHGDHHDLWIDPRNNRRMIEGSDGGGSVTLNGGRGLVDAVQPALRQHIPPGHRHQLPVPGVRHPDGQHGHLRAQPVRRGGDSLEGLLHRGQLGERLHCGAAGQPGHRLLRRAGKRARWRRPDASVRPSLRAIAADHGLAGGPQRRRTSGRETPLLLHLPHRPFAARPRRPLHRCGVRLSLHGRGAKLGGDQPRPDAQRPGEDNGAVRRLHHQGERRPGGLLQHDLHDGRIARGEGRAMDGFGRRPGPPVAGRWRIVEQRDARRGWRTARWSAPSRLRPTTPPRPTFPPRDTSGTTSAPSSSPPTTTGPRGRRSRRASRMATSPG